MTKKKQKPVASVDSKDGLMVGVSDVIRWDDVMLIQGTEVKVSKAVEMGIRHGLEIATKLEEDLKSDTGLLITFPMAMLMSELQEEIGSGAKLSRMVKP